MNPATAAVAQPHEERGAPAGSQASGRQTLGDRLRRRRDRWLASARFHRLVSALPLLRRIAQSRSEALFDLCAGFVYSQVLYACVALGLLRLLLERPQTPSELAQALALPVDRTQRLLAAAMALNLVEPRSAGRVGLGIHGATLIGNPGVEAMIRHHSLLYADLADPVDLLRRPSSPARATRMASFWSYAGAADPSQLSKGEVSGYSELMSASQQFFADIVLSAYPFSRHRRLLDVGGGEGCFALAAARRFPSLQIEVLDLPQVARQAAARFEAAGLGQRARAREGDFFADRLPEGADLVTLVRVVHDHDDARVLLLLRAVRRAMRPGATLLIAEPMAGPGRHARMADAYFGIYLLAMGSGRARNHRELEALLQQAGFEAVRRRPTANSLLATVLTARPRREAPPS